MRSRVGAALVGVALLWQSTGAQSQPAPAASPLRSFDWTYGHEPEPGNRHWTSPDGIVWTETYPSGHAEVQRVAASAVVLGCHGVITTKSYSPTSQTFIPDPDCPAMRVLFRFGDNAWGIIGLMRSESTASGPGEVSVAAGDRAHLDVLRDARSEKLKALLSHSPGDNGYRRILAAFLGADAAFQNALIERISGQGP